jgi:hypothetical protein
MTRDEIEALVRAQAAEAFPKPEWATVRQAFAEMATNALADEIEKRINAAWEDALNEAAGYHERQALLLRSNWSPRSKGWRKTAQLHEASAKAMHDIKKAGRYG